jgi:hypothetical protein
MNTLVMRRDGMRRDWSSLLTSWVWGDGLWAGCGFGVL